MLNSERETSDYRGFSTIEIKPFPDLIPGVGLVTALRRKQNLVQSIGVEAPKRLTSLTGTDGWPIPIDNKASLRMIGVAFRNNAFVGYHVLSTGFSLGVLLASI